MSYWDGKNIITAPTVPWPDAPGWEMVDCGCCAGIQWSSGDVAKECPTCDGSGRYAHHVGSGRWALYPGGPFKGREGGPPVGGRPMDAEAFWAKVRKTPDCWLWMGANDSKGYGKCRIELNGKIERGAHRAAYIIANGSIPDGLYLDHLCYTPLCVRPDHMEPVDNAENCRRQRPNTVCSQGHAMTPENTRVGTQPGRKPGQRYMSRSCITCLRERGRRAQAKRRELARE